MIFEDLYLTLKIQPPQDDFQRIMRQVDISVKAPCWIWTGSSDGGRYGQTGYKKDNNKWRIVRVHKLMAEWIYSEFPTWWRVKRSCGESLCLCPGHLVVGPSSKASGSNPELFEELWSILRLSPGRKTFNRFVEKVEAKDWESCWIWKGYCDKEGYGRFAVRGELRAHTRRASATIAEWRYGLLPKGWDTDHLRCNNTSCCNPAHLVQTTHKGNTIREGSQNICARNLRKTHCKNGHPLTSDNLCSWRLPYRICKTCVHATQAKADKKHKAKKEGQE